MFTVMCELQVIDVNPCRLVKRLSEKASERQVYLSFNDVSRMADKCPDWFQWVIWIGYYTGMRRGEIRSLTWKHVNLKRRIIYLSPQDTKEGSRKRVPIHRDLLPIFEELGRVRSLVADYVITVGGRVLGRDTIANPWPRACRKLELPKPWPRFHDLRATWKTNARRSGIDHEIRESILGHWTKAKSVSERYGFLSDDELLQSIDKMSFDHGETQVWVNLK